MFVVECQFFQLHHDSDWLVMVVAETEVVPKCVTRFARRLITMPIFLFVLNQRFFVIQLREFANRTTENNTFSVTNVT